MERKELKEWSKNKIKGHIWQLLVPILVVGILTTLTVGAKYQISEEGIIKVTSTGYNLGILFCFLNVGLVYYIVQFIKDKEYQFSDLWKFINDYIRILLVTILEGIFIFLWALLLIVPGIIKAIAYSLVDFILGDDQYKDLSYTEVLKKSEEMMMGHKMDYFVLTLSFIGWHILAIFTLGLLEIWIIPYEKVATTKFLLDVKEAYEK